MQVYKWNRRALLRKTPLLSMRVADGCVAQSFVSALVGHLEP